MKQITNEQELIECAIEGGWRKDYEIHNFSEYEVVQDPVFWQAVGKARGWVEAEIENCPDHFCFRCLEWRRHAMEYFETKLTNGSMEEYFKSL